MGAAGLEEMAPLTGSSLNSPRRLRRRMQQQHSSSTARGDTQHRQAVKRNVFFPAAHAVPGTEQPLPTLSACSTACSDTKHRQAAALHGTNQFPRAECVDQTQTTSGFWISGTQNTHIDCQQVNLSSTQSLKRWRCSIV